MSDTTKSFDPEADDNAFISAIKAGKPIDDALQKRFMSQHQDEMKMAYSELKQRAIELTRMMNREKEAWLTEAMEKLVPRWVLKQVFLKNRGWLLRFYGIRLDKIDFMSERNKKSPFELYEIRKNNRPVAVKLFKWDDGEHVEGKV